MSLEWLEIQRVRNISQASLELSPGLNLLHGQNGSGKTSILESIYFLATSRSFRSQATSAMIQQAGQDCLVTGRGQHSGVAWQMGVRRDREGGRDIRINGASVSRATDLARILPTLQLGPESVDLLLGSPGLRRRFLNWGVFHVEHDFSTLWEAANRSLRQRNLALRTGNHLELETWSAQLVRQAQKLDEARARYVAEFEPVFQAVAEELLGLREVGFEYYRGWEASASLAEIYAEDLAGDIKKGYTRKGFQRADVRLELNGQPAVTVCSRGELKALVWSLVLAQGALLQQDILYLIDDLVAEFDLEHRRRVVKFLSATGGQVLMTGIDPERLLTACEGVAGRMFHVKQGNLVLEES